MHLPFDVSVEVAHALDLPELCQLRAASRGWRDAADHVLGRRAAAAPPLAFHKTSSPLFARMLIRAHGWKSVAEYFSVNFAHRSRQKLYLLAENCDPLSPAETFWFMRKAFWQLRSPGLTRLVLRKAPAKPDLKAMRFNACASGDWDLFCALGSSAGGPFSWLAEKVSARFSWYWFRGTRALEAWLDAHRLLAGD